MKYNIEELAKAIDDSMDEVQNHLINYDYVIDISNPDEEYDATVTYFDNTIKKDIIMGYIHASDDSDDIAKQLIAYDRDARELSERLKTA